MTEIWQKNSEKILVETDIALFQSLVTWVECETIYLYGYGHSVREVAGSRLDRGTIVGGSFSSSQATGKVFSTEHTI